MKKLYEIFSRLYTKEVHASGLAIVRIFYSLVLLCEVGQLYYFRHLVFDYIPYLQPYEIDFGPALIAWIIVISFLIFGAYTRQAAIINYLFSLVFIATISTFEYHMFYVYMGVNFLLIFTNISQVYSIDRLREKLLYSGVESEYKPSEKVSVLNYYILLLVGVGFVYFDSVLFKFGSDLWLNGLGLWLPASIPPITHFNTSFLLNIKWLVLGLGYLTLAFETVFIFVFFRKKWRPWLFLVGVGLHIGIIIEFPIPWFGLGVIALYCLLVPVSWWGKIGDKLSFRKPSLTIFYDRECPLCIRTKLVLKHFDWFDALEFNSIQEYGDQTEELKEIEEAKLLSDIYAITSDGKLIKGVKTYAYAFRRMPLFFPVGLLLAIPGISNFASLIYHKVAVSRSSGRCTEDSCSLSTKSTSDIKVQKKLFNNLSTKELKVGLVFAGVVILTLLQLNVSYNSLLVNRFKRSININHTYPGQVIQRVSSDLKDVSKIFFGITNHPVFMDNHFDGYNHVIAIVHEQENGSTNWLPIIDRNGNPSWYAYSFNWVNWTFRVNSPNINQKNLRSGIKRYTAFWATKNGHAFDDLTFRIMVKKIDTPDGWQKNFLKKQMNKPWVKAGYVYWKDEKFTADIVNIEAI